MTNEKLQHIDLFSGIGGFALAADRVFGNVEHTFCDNEPFAQEVLKKHWPEAKIYGDIRTLTYASCLDDRGKPREVSSSDEQQAEKRQEERFTKSSSADSIYILTGGFPCQPFSQAGRRRGEEDDRFLWPEMLRVIQEFSPLWVIAENVRGLLTQGGGVVFERVCTDLEAVGYEVQPIVIPAVAVGAPHRRDRVWFIAHRNDAGGGTSRSETLAHGSQDSEERKHSLGRVDGQNSDAPDAESKGRKLRRPASRNSARSEERVFRRESWNTNWLEVATRLCRMDDGLPRRLDRNPRLKALGNAIVPQVAEEIMRVIKSTL